MPYTKQQAKMFCARAHDMSLSPAERKRYLALCKEANSLPWKPVEKKKKAVKKRA